MARDGYDKKAQDKIRDTGFNKRILKMLRDLNDGELLDPDDVETMERRYKLYRDYCEKYDIPISNLTAYRAIGVTKAQVDRWVNNIGFANKRRKAFIERVISDCAAYREAAMIENIIPVPTSIFWQKNYDGLKDLSETIVHVDDQWIENQSPEELAARYADVIDAEFTEKKVTVENKTPDSVKRLPEKAESKQVITISPEEEKPVYDPVTASQEESKKKERQSDE